MANKNEKMTTNYSPNFDEKKRGPIEIKFIIFHYTGMKKENKAIERLVDIKSKVSCHYFIRKNGEIIFMVPENYVAWHAGKSNWEKYSSLINFSIGVELQNSGHQYGYKNFETKQIIKDLTAKLITLCVQFQVLMVLNLH